ncbi:MAG: tetratricopeptide repeat protein [Gammaproteobacteria bacterium]|nr:tetratricopeptide repeat protein [Gammaproteobacteria bacterium]
MKRYILAAALGLSILTSVTVSAEQSSLDDLFERLQRTQSTTYALRVTNSIWRIWNTPPDPDQAMKVDAFHQALGRRNLKLARQLADGLIDAAPEYAEAWNKRAIVFFELGMYDRSLEDIDKVLSLEPRHFGAMSGRAHIHLARDELSSAYRWFSKALKVNPHLQDAKRFVESLGGSEA